MEGRDLPLITPRNCESNVLGGNKIGVGKS